MAETPNTLANVLQELINTSDPAPQVVRVPAPNGVSELVALREGYELHHLPGQTAGARRHTFHDVSSFAEWLNRHAVDPSRTTEILVARRSVTATDRAVEDPGGDRVVCELELHPHFARWEEAFGKPMTQRELFSMVRAVMPTFAALPGTDTASYGTLLAQTLSSLRVVSTGSVEVRIDATGMIQFAGGDAGREISAKIPSEIHLDLPIFEGVEDSDGALHTYALEVLIECDTSSGAPVFALEAPTLELAERQARRDVASMLERKLLPDFLVGIGTHQIVGTPKR